MVSRWSIVSHNLNNNVIWLHLSPHVCHLSGFKDMSTEYYASYLITTLNAIIKLSDFPFLECPRLDLRCDLTIHKPDQAPVLNQWLQSLFRCRIELLNFSMGFLKHYSFFFGDVTHKSLHCWNVRKVFQTKNVNFLFDRNPFYFLSVICWVIITQHLCILDIL